MEACENDGLMICSSIVTGIVGTLSVPVVLFCCCSTSVLTNSGGEFPKHS